VAASTVFTPDITRINDGNTVYAEHRKSVELFLHFLTRVFIHADVYI
jgi:hypothetical protein